jgi:hypothetical protein
MSSSSCAFDRRLEKRFQKRETTIERLALCNFFWQSRSHLLVWRRSVIRVDDSIVAREETQMPLMDLSRRIKMKWIKPPVLMMSLAPLAALVWKAFHDELGANPIEVITHSTGTWTLVFLCVTLSITPLRRLLHQGWLVRFRRMFGLFAFFYGCLHLATYVWLDKSFDFSAMTKDLYKRPFITAGFTAFLLMVPLAVTSTSGTIRRLGGKR